MTETEEIQEQTGRVVKIHRKNAARDFPHRQPGTAISVQTPSGEIQEGRVIASLRSFKNADEGRCNITTSVILTSRGIPGKG